MRSVRVKGEAGESDRLNLIEREVGGNERSAGRCENVMGGYFVPAAVLVTSTVTPPLPSGLME
jgi:hypothetical protein